jgi:hypothetical protein
MGKYKFELKCKFCYAIFDWPDEGWISMSNRDDLNQYVVVCPGVKKDMVATHCEIVGKESNEIMNFEERFYIMEEIKN